ncbi:hypothetical protein D877_gp18 [Edwardsiella phage KF-1]|uniref:Uncharacterized protein n=1 Tax=Edwardsiella phage KF-1 TaxID=1244856 RepID=K4PW78_9CAUD|nr:hypothetical protein D877_gp18 [Edwardsiella phage KF-1]BAM63066.1 hypothetical protein [Edwardsiella phage KF-1]
MSVLIEAWRSGFFTEDEVCKGFGVTHKEFRSTLLSYGLPLPAAEQSAGLWAEVYNNKPENVMRATAEYGVRLNLMVKFCTEKPGDALTREAVLAMRGEGLTVAQIAKHYSVTQYYVRKLLPKCNRLVIDKEAITADIMEGKLSLLDIAVKHEVSPSLVSKLNPNKIKKTRGEGLDDATLANMRADLQRFNVSEVARLYGVSRGYVYAHRKATLQEAD